MRFGRILPWVLLLAWLPGMAWPQAVSQDEADLAARLDTVRAEIAAIQLRLSEDLGERDAALDQLADAERDVSSAERARRETEQQIGAVELNIQGLDAQRESLQESMDTIGRQLAEQLNFVYRQGNPSRLEILLNQDDPRRLNRQLAYHGYLSRRRLDVVQSLQATAVALEENRLELIETQASLQRLAARQDDNIRELAAAREAREAVLEVIEARVQSNQEELAGLQEDER